jgi:hypothetical protein
VAVLSIEHSKSLPEILTKNVRDLSFLAMYSSLSSRVVVVADVMSYADHTHTPSPSSPHLREGCRVSKNEYSNYEFWFIQWH